MNKKDMEKDLKELKSILPTIATVEVDLLDFYAGCALIGMYMAFREEWTTGTMAARCFGMAEAMLKERKKYVQDSTENPAR